MRRIASALLVGVFCFSVCAQFVHADGMILPLPENLNSGYLAVRYHRVSVRIEDGHAVTLVEQVFYNPHGFPVEGRYLFPIPPDAIVSRFQATVDGEPQAVTRQSPAETNASLYAVVNLQRDPSLLQYADWETLAFGIDLLPGESKEMSLEYEEVLVPAGGLYHYRYVLSTERYSSLPLEEVSVSVDIRSSFGLGSIYSPSHQIHVETSGPIQARARWQAHDITPSEDFELYFSAADGGFGGGLLGGERNGEEHFAFLFSPETVPQESDYLPKDIVFVIDRSGSMDGEKIEHARGALRHILSQLREDDRFSIVGFDDRITLLDSVLRPVDDQNLKDARRFVQGLTAEGYTDLASALQTGLEILARSESAGASRMVVFLTDGLPTAGVTNEETIAHLVARANARLEARLHIFGVGYDVNTHLLDGLAAEHGGTVTYVQPGEDLEMALTDLYGKIARPILTDLQVDFKGVRVDDVYPAEVPDLFAGSSLLLTGRYQALGERVTVHVSGRSGDQRREYVYHFYLSDIPRVDFVPRLWATRRVGVLLDQVRTEGSNPSLEDEIRQLGLNYGIVTPYTAYAIQGQQDGAASADNMALYQSAELNKSSGRVTVQARVQNQMYQQATQAELATGANVSNIGRQSLVEIGGQQVDLVLLQGKREIDGSVTRAWLKRNVSIDRTVEFGSEEYYALAGDPEARLFLQSGTNVVFAHKGEVIAVQDQKNGESPANAVGSGKQESAVAPRAGNPGLANGAAVSREAHIASVNRVDLSPVLDILGSSYPSTTVVVLLGLLLVAVVSA
jgi:Ca-activated chloride channel family protein